ncbi:hypothetical protein BKA83DRAFT_4493415 [Pisolithus microcarpus]|nr:hypothetical protein BKA83DRAFT_4493415 [Pisolithus microcarpus]
MGSTSVAVRGASIYGGRVQKARPKGASKGRVHLGGASGRRAPAARGLYLLCGKSVPSVDCLRHPQTPIPSYSSFRLFTSILLFNFKLIHIPATKHAPPDGLSRRPKAKEDPKVDKVESEDWVDECGGFTIKLGNHWEPKSHLLCPPEILLFEY